MTAPAWRSDVRSSRRQRQLCQPSAVEGLSLEIWATKKIEPGGHLGGREDIRHQTSWAGAGAPPSPVTTWSSWGWAACARSGRSGGASATTWTASSPTARSGTEAMSHDNDNYAVCRWSSVDWSRNSRQRLMRMESLITILPIWDQFLQVCFYIHVMMRHTQINNPLI